MISDPDIEWLANGIPRSRQFEDIYFDAESPVQESEYNFLQGNDLPRRWMHRSCDPWDSFCIGETGFGTGLNFLLALDAWRSSHARGRLHYVSVEKYPLSTDQLVRAHAGLPSVLAPLAHALRERYVTAGRGFHRIEFPAWRVALTLIIDDATTGLSQLEARVDAWFLDGFSPSRNPDMWNTELYRQLARLSGENTTLATFTAAGHVRRGLESHGFRLRKVAGFGSKRERLVGYFAEPGGSRLPGWARCPVARRDSVQVRGHGISGRSLVDALSRRSVPTEVVQAPAASGSGVPRAMVKPRLSADRSPAARLFSSACSYATAMYQRWDCFEPQVVRQRVRSSEQDRARKMVANWPDWLHWNGDDELLCRGAGYVDTGRLADVPSNSVDDPAIRVDATGIGLNDYSRQIPLTAYRGQVTLFDTADHVLDGVLSDGHYLLGPHRDHPWQTGATFDHMRPEERGAAEPVAEDDQRNLESAEALLPGLHESARIRGHWAGLRMATPDRLPVAGPIIDVEQYVEALSPWSAMREKNFQPAAARGFILGALGSRGFTTAPLCAELLVSQWFGEPWPIERDIALLLHSARFVIREIKRGERTAR